MISTTDKGKSGEEIAVTYLQQQGMAIIDRNWRSGHLEIDIIARDKNMLVFVEVKSRETDLWGEPQINVTIDKQRNIIKAANRYVLSQGIDIDTRFDIISIIMKDGNNKISHLPNAFSIY